MKGEEFTVLLLLCHSVPSRNETRLKITISIREKLKLLELQPHTKLHE